MEEVDEKGLLFLLRQAQVLIHNARMESLGGGVAAPVASRPLPESVEIEDARRWEDDLPDDRPERGRSSLPKR